MNPYDQTSDGVSAFGLVGLLAWAAGTMRQNPTLTAGIVGIMLSLACTQLVKNILPDSLSDARYKAFVRLIGFFTGWAFGYGAWRLMVPTATAFADVYWASGVGFLSPVTYSMIVPWLCHKWPFLDQVLSGRPNGHP